MNEETKPKLHIPLDYTDDSSIRQCVDNLQFHIEQLEAQEEIKEEQAEQAMIAEMEAQIARTHFGMADARAEALTKQIAAWTAEVNLANDNLKIIQTAKERRLEAENKQLRRLLIESHAELKRN